MNIKTFLINLDSNPDRLAFMDAQLKREGVDYTRFNAIRGDTLPEWLHRYFFTETDHKASWLSSGEIGCYASHLAIMRSMTDSEDAVLVMEDDIAIPPDFAQIIRDCMDAPIKWDILRLSSMDRYPVLRHLKVGKDHHLVSYLKVPTNTGAYLIKPSAAKKFLELDLPRRRPVDQDLRRTWENGICTVGVFPRPVLHNQLPSVIEAIGDRVKKSGNLKYRYDSKYRDRLSRFVFNSRTFGLWRTIKGMLVVKPKLDAD